VATRTIRQQGTVSISPAAAGIHNPPAGTKYMVLVTDPNIPALKKFVSIEYHPSEQVTDA
jgi:hypothetical protein